MIMKLNNRIIDIGEYHFKNLDLLKKTKTLNGEEVFDLSIGDPKMPVHENIKKALVESLNLEGFNNYPPYEGIEELKYKIIEYYHNVFNVNLTKEEVVVLIGSKEGISNIVPSVCDVGDYVIVPDPGYPVYKIATKLWGCIPYSVPLKENKGYLIETSEIPQKITEKAKLMFVNYPNNPTGAVANKEGFEELIEFSYKNNLVLCNDSAYNEIVDKDEKIISLLQFDKEKRCIEFGSLSKIYNMTGFRIGYAVGNSEVIKKLSNVKSNLDSGQFIPIQKAAVEALSINREYNEKVVLEYSKRKEVAKKILKEKNIKFFDGKGTFYIWCRTPKGYTSNEFCLELLNRYGIIVTPGEVFGIVGYDYFRISLTENSEVIEKCLSRLDKYQ